MFKCKSIKTMHSIQLKMISRPVNQNHQKYFNLTELSNAMHNVKEKKQRVENITGCKGIETGYTNIQIQTT